MSDRSSVSNAIRMNQHSCPYCREKLTAAAPAQDKSDIPAPGDVVVCFYCGEIACYDEDMELQKADPFLLAQNPCYPLLLRIQREIRKYRAQKTTPN